MSDLVLEFVYNLPHDSQNTQGKSIGNPGLRDSRHNPEFYESPVIGSLFQPDDSTYSVGHFSKNEAYGSPRSVIPNGADNGHLDGAPSDRPHRNGAYPRKPDSGDIHGIQLSGVSLSEENLCGHEFEPSTVEHLAGDGLLWR